MLKKSRLFILLACMLSLSACTLFKPIPNQPLHYYTLTALPPACPTIQKTRSTILVTQPRANALYSNPRMIYSPDCYQIQYFTQNRWADTPPHMLHLLLIKSLQNTGYFQAIINTPATTYYDWIVNTQLLSFQQEFISNPSQFRIAIRVQLINAHTNRIMATKDFMVVQPAPMDNPHGAAIAANMATQKILRKIAVFCLDRIE
ncbi:ABC transporter [Candidatus Rickettsiella viridis]|uniref:ABC transporter n=1 Tax=Candidatus Rickettsiella viridis TaxID=676208 RepID=A0A2Z5V4R3_9COXI|nr:ABC transporter [Candidatus Rickettsiella viridis]